MNAMNFKNPMPISESSPQSKTARAPLPLSAFAPQVHRAPANAGNRLIGIVVAVGVQLVLLAGLTFGTFDRPPAPTPEPLIVDLLPAEQETTPPPPPPKPALATPNIVTNTPPVFQIYEPPPLVSTTAPPAPNAPVTSPVPVGGNAEAVIESYQIRLLRHLNRHKRYPSGARAKREQGVVYVRFAMDRRGNVLSASIETSCHFPALDNEGLALLARAQPLPIPPMEVAGDPIEMIVPVEFSLKR